MTTVTASITDTANDGDITTVIGGMTLQLSSGEGGFARFADLTVPQGATITAASMTVGTSGLTTISCVLSAAADDDASAPAATMPAETTATVAWDATVSGTTATSPDLSAIIQEIVSRTGWSSGNALVLLADQGATAGFGRADNLSEVLSVTYMTGPAVTKWDGSSEVPMTVTRWDGTAEVAVTLELAS